MRIVDFETIRLTEFPAAAKGIHLKASGGSPMCRSAFDAAEAYLQEMCFEGDLHYAKYLDNINEARALVAGYLNASPGEIGFSVSSSSSASIMAAMLQRAGVNRVYFPIGEFPTSVHAVRNLGLDARAVGDAGLKDGWRQWRDAIDLDLERDPCDGRAALVASHVSFLNGAALDIGDAARFCKARGLISVVNATQSFGALEIDVQEGVDMLFATGLKWLCAGYGAGFIYIRQALVDTFGLPRFTGWLSVANPYRMDHTEATPLQAARALDAGGGMPHFGPLLSLYGALQLYERVGEGSIRAGVRAVQLRTLHLATTLRSRLIKAGFNLLGDPDAASASGIVTIVAPEAPALHEKLSRHRIHTSLRLHPESGTKTLLRFGIHFFNTEKEIDTVLSVVE